MGTTLLFAAHDSMVEIMARLNGSEGRAPAARLHPGPRGERGGATPDDTPAVGVAEVDQKAVVAMAHAASLNLQEAFRLLGPVEADDNLSHVASQGGHHEPGTTTAGFVRALAFLDAAQAARTPETATSVRAAAVAATAAAAAEAAAAEQARTSSSAQPNGAGSRDTPAPRAAPTSFESASTPGGQPAVLGAQNSTTCGAATDTMVVLSAVGGVTSLDRQLAREETAAWTEGEPIKVCVGGWGGVWTRHRHTTSQQASGWRRRRRPLVWSTARQLAHPARMLEHRKSHPLVPALAVTARVCGSP